MYSIVTYVITTLRVAYLSVQSTIIESVDCICRDSVDMQYMLIRKNFSKSPKQLTYKPLQHPTVHLPVFSWWKTHPVVLKSIAKVPNQKVTRWPKRFSFFFFFRRASSNLCDSFTMVFTQNSSIFTEQCTSSLLLKFLQVWSHEAIRTTQWRTMASFTTPFFFTCTHEHKSLSNEM